MSKRAKCSDVKRERPKCEEDKPTSCQCLQTADSKKSIGDFQQKKYKTPTHVVGGHTCMVTVVKRNQVLLVESNWVKSERGRDE